MIFRRRIDDRQFDLVRFTREVSRLSFDDHHLFFNGGQANQQLTNHQQGDAQVNDNDAATFLEKQNAAGQQHGPRDSTLQQLPHNPQRTIAQSRFAAGHDQIDGQYTQQDAAQSIRPPFQSTCRVRLQPQDQRNNP